MVALTRRALERAVANNELLLYYQPKVSLLSGDVIGGEALVRWNDQNNDIIAPSVFLPQAERMGLLHDITIRLLDQLVDAIQTLRTHKRGLSLSINVAPNDLAAHNISERIRHYLGNRSINAEELQIEITESAVMGNFEQIQADVVHLSDMGIRVLMDDFGTGYSSIDRLSQLPFSSLKLDQGVVQRMGTSRQNLDVVKSCISMARELHMTSVAEGVESSAQYSFLMANGCEEAQGFFISRPMALADFCEFASRDHDFAGSQIGRVHQAVFNVLHYRKCLFDVVFCHGKGPEDSLQSVMEPDVTSLMSESRLGLWYFGVGQVLAGMPEFDVLEKPIRELHQQGHKIIEMAGASVGTTRQPLAMQSQAVADLDSRANVVIALLHALATALLRH